MSNENPYAEYLGDQEPLKVLSLTARKIEAILEDLGSVRVNQPPAPGKWSACEIVCHLADCELVFAYRMRQTISEEHHVIQPFDQEKWAAPYSSFAVKDALAAFTALRVWNLKLIAVALPDSASKLVTHPERGTMTFQSIVETMAGHDLNHLAQLKRIASD